MGFTEFLAKNYKVATIITAIVIAIIVMIIMTKPFKAEGLANFMASAEPEKKTDEEHPVPDVEFSEEELAGAEFRAEENDNEITPKDLLPMSQGASDFDKDHPVAQNSLDSKNFLTAGFNIGINTVANSNRNANLSLRADPPIPVTATGPWNQTTILPDTHRKSLDIC